MRRSTRIRKTVTTIPPAHVNNVWEIKNELVKLRGLKEKVAELVRTSKHEADWLRHTIIPDTDDPESFVEKILVSLKLFKTARESVCHLIGSIPMPVSCKAVAVAKPARVRFSKDEDDFEPVKKKPSRRGRPKRGQRQTVAASTRTKKSSSTATTAAVASLELFNSFKVTARRSDSSKNGESNLFKNIGHDLDRCNMKLPELERKNNINLLREHQFRQPVVVKTRDVNKPVKKQRKKGAPLGYRQTTGFQLSNAALLKGTLV